MVSRNLTSFLQHLGVIANPNFSLIDLITVLACPCNLAVLSGRTKDLD